MQRTLVASVKHPFYTDSDIIGAICPGMVVIVRNAEVGIGLWECCGCLALGFRVGK